MEKKVHENKARQGRLGVPVLFVLIGGLLLAMVFWGFAEIYGYVIAPEAPLGDPQTPPGTSDPDGG